MKGTQNCKIEPCEVIPTMLHVNVSDKNCFLKSVITTFMPAPYRCAHVLERYSGFVMAPHSHHFYQIIYVTSGELIVYAENRKYTLGPNQFIMFKPDVIHVLHSPNGYSQLGIDIFNQTDTRNVVQVLEETITENITSGFMYDFPSHYDSDSLVKQISDQSPLNVLKLTHIVESFVLEIIEQTATRSIGFREKFLNFVSGSEGAFKTVDEISEMMNMSKTHLERMVKREFQCGAAEFCLRTRLMKSCLLLNETNMPIKSICEKLRFYDESHFNRMFRKYLGTTPNKYRKESNKFTTVFMDNDMVKVDKNNGTKK